MSELDALRARLDRAFQDGVAAGEVPSGRMAAGWVFTAVVVDEDGETNPLFACADRIGLETVLGLLRLSTLNWEEAARSWMNHDD